MKKLVKRIVALGLAVTATLTLGVTANAATQYFTGSTGYKLKFKLGVNVSTLAGAAYKLDVTATEIHDNPYYYPSLYVKAVLYGTGSTNSTSDKTLTNAYEGYATVSRGVEDCAGKGYGNFRAYGNTAYGDVYGTVYV